MSMGEDSWKNKTLIVGGVLGTLIGVGAALLYIRAEEEALDKRRNEPVKPRGVSPAALLPIAIALLGVLRQIGGLADRD
jgi:hypothetical protein